MSPTPGTLSGTHCLCPCPHSCCHPHPPTRYLQARRLDELEKLYREEVVARKRAHNALQDLKGKIRVFCRVRPMLDFEANKKQVGAVMQCVARGLEGWSGGGALVATGGHASCCSW